MLSKESCPKKKPVNRDKISNRKKRDAEQKQVGVQFNEKKRERQELTIGAGETMSGSAHMCSSFASVWEKRGNRKKVQTTN